MKKNIFLSAILTLAGTCLTACSQEEIVENENLNGKPEMNFTFSMPGTTKATETAFEVGDMVGLYVHEAYKPLEIGGNTVSNVMLTCEGNSWKPKYKIFWDDGTYNARAYYPYQTQISSIEDYPFEVRQDQNTPESGNAISGFEASDFLCAAKDGIVSSSSPVSMQFKHIMSKLTVNLVKGEDYEGELPEHATVKILSTVTASTIDLDAGVATKDMYGSSKTITAMQTGRTSYSAIIVPQRIENRVPLIEIIIDGVSFIYESRFVFKPGVHHTMNVVVDKNANQVLIEIGGEVTGWN